MNKKITLLVIIVVLIAAAGYMWYSQQYGSGKNTGGITNTKEGQILDHSAYFINGPVLERVEVAIPEDRQVVFDRQLAEFIELQSHETESYQGYMGEANYYQTTGDYATALEKMKAMVALFPEDELVYQNLATLYKNMQQYLLAAENYDIAIHKKPEELQPYLMLANLYVQYASDPLQAEEIYKYALLQTGSDNDIVRSYASFLENEKRDTQAALIYWRQALEQTPETDQLYSVLQEHIAELEQTLN